MTPTHVPVLVEEVVDLLDPHPGEAVVDCTFGAGGHARALAERLGPTGTLIAIDRDPDAAERFAAFAAEAPCLTRFLPATFVDGLRALRAEDAGADVILLDLGMSSMQVDTRERGFSYAYEAPLDMRMDPFQALSAFEVVNEWDERRLAGLLREYGEERYAPRIARAIVRARAQAPVQTTTELVDLVAGAVPAPVRFAGGHPAKRTFQAIRIAVNDELSQLDEALPVAWDVLRPGGRLGAISFHSLEDRRVKRFLVARAQGCVCPPQFPVCVCGHEPEAELVVRGGVVAGAEEVAANGRAASARLRVARRVGVTA